ncbi:unnamed protein product [Didymodactylos carnosus]|uniref:Clathrin/coatomer adaptor adaptin-like N-terminal domain-containing protein n=1 Tax=Didymodactylos carnosus TaxID=1234261 RepID=A0A815JFP8_9BILA|nr:unnamed protein product [Didymodactylos carnosus]CAF4271706.1 unnamed protein product [Didymodactylos carnosus]
MNAEWVGRRIHLLYDQHFSVETGVGSLIEALVIHIIVSTSWLCVKLLITLRNCPPPDDPSIHTRLNECLDTILNKDQEPFKSEKVQHSNARNAVLFEAINLIIHMDCESTLLVRACNQPGQFLQNREGENERAVDILYAMCDRSNAQDIVQERLAYLETTDYTITEEMVWYRIIQVVCNINDEDDADEPLDEVIMIHEMKSPFKMDFSTIYNEVSKTVNNYNNDKIWDNPVYCPDFLTILLEKFMDTAPIWSNLLLDDLSRYGYKNLPNYIHCGCLIKRTTGISESRTNYVKNVITQICGQYENMLQVKIFVEMLLKSDYNYLPQSWLSSLANPKLEQFLASRQTITQTNYELLGKVSLLDKQPQPKHPFHHYTVDKLQQQSQGEKQFYETLQALNNQFKLSSMLCRCRTPDYILKILNRKHQQDKTTTSWFNLFKH